MVIEVVTLSSGMPSKRISKSSSEETATPSLPTSPRRHRVVGVVAHQRGHIEGGGEPGHALLEEVLEALVGVRRRAEAGELPHRPEPAAVHRRLDAAGERELPGQPEVLEASRCCRSAGGEHVRDGDAGVGDEGRTPQRRLGQDAGQILLGPLLQGLRHLLQRGLVVGAGDRSARRDALAPAATSRLRLRPSWRAALATLVQLERPRSPRFGASLAPAGLRLAAASRRALRSRALPPCGARGLRGRLAVRGRLRRARPLLRCRRCGCSFFEAGAFEGAIAGRRSIRIGGRKATGPGPSPVADAADGAPCSARALRTELARSRDALLDCGARAGCGERGSAPPRASGPVGRSRSSSDPTRCVAHPPRLHRGRGPAAAWGSQSR